jgi:drug/metabolite transporter (DMT)-like permease
VLRTGERPSAAFWAACAAGAGAVVVFALVRGNGLPTPADGLTVLAVLCAATGYAEGARLAPLLGSDQMICWALVLALPAVLPVLALDLAQRTPTADAAGWACFTYTAAVSMFLGFFAWYRGLALGGVAKVSQVQLAQPLLTVTASVLLFGQRLTPAVVVAAVAVIACVAAAQRTRVRPAAAGDAAGPATRRPARPSRRRSPPSRPSPGRTAPR